MPRKVGGGGYKSGIVIVIVIVQWNLKVNTMGKEEKKSRDKDEEAINEMNDFSAETKKNRFHKKKDKVYIVNKLTEKEQKVDEKNDHEHDEKIKDEAKEKKRKTNK